jgi:hypothetical protein
VAVIHLDSSGLRDGAFEDFITTTHGFISNENQMNQDNYDFEASVVYILSS